MKLLSILFIFISSVFAHPHTFIEVFPTLHVEDKKITNIHFKWVLDEMSSTILIMELDSDGDGKISKNENDFIEKEYFSMFEDYGYYTFIKVDSKLISTPKPKNFKATIENNRICYSFDIEKEFNIQNTIFDFADTSYYVAMVLKEEFLTLDGATAKISRVDSDDYYGFRLELK